MPLIAGRNIRWLETRANTRRGVASWSEANEVTVSEITDRPSSAIVAAESYSVTLCILQRDHFVFWAKKGSKQTNKQAKKQPTA